MAQGILVFIEQRGGHLRKASLEALSEAVRLASGQAVTAVLIGENIKGLVPSVAKYGASKVFIADKGDFAQYSTEGYAAAFADAIKQAQPQYVFAASTSMAKDLLPRLAARFDAPLVTDVMVIKTEGRICCRSNQCIREKPMARMFLMPSSLSSPSVPMFLRRQNQVVLARLSSFLPPRTKFEPR